MKPCQLSKKNTIFYFFGALFIAIGVVLVIRSRLGTSPWDALHYALSVVTPMTIGLATIFVASVATAIVILIQKKSKYLFMAIPIVIVGAFIDLFDLVILSNFEPSGVMQGVSFFAGILLMPLGGALLMMSTYPAGVFDELMLALMRVFKTNNLVGVRIALETVPLSIALLLTLSFHQSFGMVNVGTAIFILTIGPLLQLYIKLIRRLDNGN